MSVIEKLKQFISFKSFKIRQFEESFGTGNGYMNSIVNSIGAKNLPRIFELSPDIDRDWLLYGEGEMLRTPPENNTRVVGTNVSLDPNDPHVFRIPDYGEMTAQHAYIHAIWKA